MQISKAGIILFTASYEDCVAFYGEVLGLPVLFRLDTADSTLTCFDLGGAYLMVEPGGPRFSQSGDAEQSPVKLRFNVEDVETSAMELRNKGVEVTVRHHGWGTTAEFADPDGNRCALRSDQGFGV